MKKSEKKLLIILLSVASIIIGFTIWDIFIDPPAWWRFDRLEDKKAILSYVEENYPKTIKRTGSKFPFQKPAGSFEHSVISFELDGVNFNVSAWKGKITDDTYYEAKAEKFIRENFIDGFIDERGLSPEIKISFVIPPEHYGLLQEYILDDLYSFTGSVNIFITQAYIDGVSTPKDVGWFYDFYQYWVKNCDLPKCVVYMYYSKPNSPTNCISFTSGKRRFFNEDEFYNSFNTVI